MRLASWPRGSIEIVCSKRLALTHRVECLSKHFTGRACLMRWRSLSILMAASLGALGLFLVFWSISFADPFYFSRSFERSESRVLFLSGRIYWIWADQAGFVVDSRYTVDDFDEKTLSAYKQTYLTSPKPSSGLIGFGRVKGKDADGRAYAVTSLPFWPAMLLLTPAVLWLLERRERQRRIDLHLCLNCGYDIQESCKQCPKCGWILPYELALQAALKHSVREQARLHEGMDPNPQHLDPLVLRMQPPEVRPHRGNGKTAR